VRSYLDGSHIRVLRDVLVLVESIFGSFSFSQVDRQFDKKEHHRLQGGDGAVPRAFRGDMFVEDIEGRLGLLDGDEFLRSL
jgi:hypothetical protein